MLEKLNKLKGRSFAELRDRAAQALSAQAERRGLSAQSRLPSDRAFFRLLDAKHFEHAPGSAQNLLEHFRQRTPPKFFAGFDDTEATREELQHRFLSGREALIEKADRITQGRFDLLGFRKLDFGEPVDWHLEPLSGKRSPLTHWSLIDELDASTGDKKIVWELNRHQYFAVLGRAYLLTKDERYAETFASHLAGWMDANPPKLGLNWLSSLEIAFRSISWLWAFYFFKDSPHLAPALFSRALKYLYLHARHLENYLSTYSSPNTHLTGEALGLFYLGTLLPELRDAARWREKGKGILLAELDRHVLADGVYFERTSYYHRYTTDFYTHFLILAERNGEAVSEKLRVKLQSLQDHLMHLTRPDGTTPFIGDDDGGRLSLLDESDANDFRSVLSTGAALFERGDYKFVAGEVREETLWLLGREGVKKFEQLASQTPSEMSRAFSDGGYYVMRDGWTQGANYLLIDGGQHGALSFGHSHADAFSIELSARGRTLLVDPGTFTYTGSPELRDYFRSSLAHNTLTIDDESSSVPGGAFNWKHVAQAAVSAWQTHPRFDYFAGQHDGYMRFEAAPTMHMRSVLFLKNDYWMMRDTVETGGAHRYELHFHFAPHAHPCFEDYGETEISLSERAFDVPGLEIFSFGNEGEWRTQDGWVSACYGARTKASICTFSATGTGAQELFSFLIPRRSQETNARVREIEAIGGRAFELHDKASRDFLLAGSGALVETARLASDFKWTWARFSSDGETLEELVLIDGKILRLDGREILNLPMRASYIYAHRAGDKLHLEIDDKLTQVSFPLEELVTSAPFANLKTKN